MTATPEQEPGTADAAAPAEKQRPEATAQALAARAAREAREAAALRRNLRGRKEQQRGRAEPAGAGEGDGQL